MFLIKFIEKKRSRTEVQEKESMMMIHMIMHVWKTNEKKKKDRRMNGMRIGKKGDLKCCSCLEHAGIRCSRQIVLNEEKKEIGLNI